MESHSIDLVLLGAGAIFAFVWGLGTFWDPEIGLNMRVFLTGTLMLCGVWLASGALSFSGKAIDIVWVKPVAMPIVCFLGPLFYRSVQLALDGNGQPNKILKSKDLLLFIPAAAVSLLYVCTGLLTLLDRDISSIGQIFSVLNPVALLMSTLPVKVLIIFYVCLLMLRHRYIFFLGAALPAGLRRGFLIILLAVVAGLILGGVGIVLDEHTFARLSAHTLPFILYYFFIFVRSHPAILNQLHESVDRVRYRQSRLLGIDVQDFAERLESLMSEERIYADEDLTLGRLAQMLGLNSHQLSEILNNHLHKSFPHFISEYRVAAARQLLVSEPERSSLSIGMAVGFNSKSAFHRAFSKITGMPPQKYRKKFAVSNK